MGKTRPGPKLTTSPAPSVESTSDEDDHYIHSILQQAESHSGSSSHPGDYSLPHLPFPSDLAIDDLLHSSDSASRLSRGERAQPSRTSSRRQEAGKRRQVPTTHTAPRTRPRARAKPPSIDSESSESESESDGDSETGDSTEDFITGIPGYAGPVPRSTSYHGHNGYPQSAVSSAYGYPPIPQAGPMVHYGAHPQGPMRPSFPAHHAQHPHAPQQRQQMQPQARNVPTSGGPTSYPQSQTSHHPGMSFGPPSHAGSHFGASPYGPQSVVQQNPYGPPAGYFPHGYPPPHGVYHGGYPQPHPYPQHGVPPLPAHLDAWRVPPHPAGGSVSSSSSERPALDSDAIVKRMEAMILAQNEERQVAIRSADEQLVSLRKKESDRREEEAQIRRLALEEARKQADAQAAFEAQRRAEEARVRKEAQEEAERQAEARARAEQKRREEELRFRKEALELAKAEQEQAAKVQRERAADEARIRKEATEAAEKAIAAAARADAERAAREAQIRAEAAKEALDKAAAEAKAKAEAEARDAKMKKEAAEAAKAEAEKKAADEAKAAEEKVKAAHAEQEKKLKEAEEAAAKAKAEAEAAKKAEEALKPPERRPPVRFKDAIGRNYNFPWERCCKWRDMEGLIVQAFQHIDNLGEHVVHRRYDLIGPDKEIIMPEYWDVTIQPDMQITMMLWPLPEPSLLDLPPPPGGDIGIIDLGDLGKKKHKKKSGSAGNALSNWMLGGAPRSRKSLKDDKKPEGAQNGAADDSACIVM